MSQNTQEQAEEKVYSSSQPAVGNPIESNDRISSTQVSDYSALQTPDLSEISRSSSQSTYVTCESNDASVAGESQLSSSNYGSGSQSSSQSFYSLASNNFTFDESARSSQN